MLRSSLPVDIGNKLNSASIDERNRQDGLRPIREEVQQEVLTVLVGLSSPSSAPITLLDVGAGSGWFLSAAERAGFAAQGIEPDPDWEVSAEDQVIRRGYFPECVEDGELFDVICFNDVLEHIPDVRGVVRSAREHLTPGGLLALCVPTSEGIGYRIANRLRTVGINGPFERLWQRGYPSPHLWYFREDNLITLAKSEGLRITARGRLKSIEREGLQQRIQVAGRFTLTDRVAFLFAWLAAPILNSPSLSDALLVVFRNVPDESVDACNQD